MAEEDDDSKTEDPSDRKIQRAREEGQVPQSGEARTLTSLLGLLVAVSILVPSAVRKLHALMGALLANFHGVDLDVRSLQQLLATLLIDVGIILAPFFSVMMLIAIIGGIAQVGLLFTPSKIAFKLSNIDPLSGFKRIFSVNQLIELLKGVLKIVIVAVISYWVLRPMFLHPDIYTQQDLSKTLDGLYWMLVKMTMTVVGTFALVAAGDYIWQRLKHWRQLKMTKQEVKDEHKQQDGDPLIKSKIRQLRARRIRERIAQAVPQASVVITNPTHFAIALAYEMEEMAAPKCVAKGADFLAQKIKELAKEHDVPIVENPPLARALYASVEIDQEVPPEHYKAVAEVIGYVMRLKRKPLPPRAEKKK